MFLTYLFSDIADIVGNPRNNFQTYKGQKGHQVWFLRIYDREIVLNRLDRLRSD